MGRITEVYWECDKCGDKILRKLPDYWILVPNIVENECLSEIYEELDTLQARVGNRSLYGTFCSVTCLIAHIKELLNDDKDGPKN